MKKCPHCGGELRDKPNGNKYVRLFQCSGCSKVYILGNGNKLIEKTLSA